MQTINSILVRNLLTLLSLIIFASDAQGNKLPGDDINLETAAHDDEAFCIAEFEQMGRPSLGAPGETFYANSRIKVMRNIRTGDFGTRKCQFSVQRLPSDPSETIPRVGQLFLIIGNIVNGELRISKVAEPTNHNIQMVERILRERGVDLDVPKANLMDASDNKKSKAIEAPHVKPLTREANAAAQQKTNLQDQQPLGYSVFYMITIGVMLVGMIFWLWQRR
jgi:hypothetical protein